MVSPTVRPVDSEARYVIQKATAPTRARITSPIATYCSACKPFDPRIHLRIMVHLLHPS
jgi:hypothetical protein